MVGGLGWEELGVGVEDGPRPSPVPMAASQATVPFRAHEFVPWAPSLKINIIM